MFERILTMMKSLKSSLPDIKKGQSLVELTLLFPVLIILISGLVEFGFMLNQYLAVVDAARNAARFSSDSLYYNRDSNTNCDQTAGSVTTDFYMLTACVVMQELDQERPTIVVDLDGGDDILISAFTLVGGSSPIVSSRHPSGNGWSYSATLRGTPNQASVFTSAQVTAHLQPGAPSTGLILVEVFYHYDQLLGVPWITAFIPNPVVLHAYSFMPLVSAEPTEVPSP